jgi:ankyrin repeat protein
MASLTNAQREQRALEVLCLVAFCGHPSHSFCSLTRAFRGDETLWGCIKDRNGRNGWTFLMASSAMGDLARVRWLLERGAIVNAADENTGLTEEELETLTSSQRIELSMLDLPDEKRDFGKTALILACMRGHLETVRSLLAWGAEVNASQTGCGWTSLMWACKTGHLGIVLELLARGADVDAGESYDWINAEDEWDCLSLACCGGYLEIVHELIGHGVDTSCKQVTHCLEVAGECAEFEIAQVMLELGADVNNSLTQSRSLESACCGGNLALVHDLLVRGAHVNSTSSEEHFYISNIRTPLMIACDVMSLEIVRELIEWDADVNIAAKDGTTALILAYSHQSDNRVEILQELLENGANVDAVSSQDRGMTILMKACRDGNLEVARLFLAHNASRTLVDQPGQSYERNAYRWASKKLHPELKALVKPD